MIYTLYCAEDRDYTYHSVEDNKETKIQTIKCLRCGHTQENKILGRRVSVDKGIYEAWEKKEKKDQEKEIHA